jgi:cation/acetate symporter
VTIVGIVVVLIVATAGMASTTYVQFLKGALLIVFSLVITILMLMRGLDTEPDQGGRVAFYEPQVVSATVSGDSLTVADPAYTGVDYFAAEHVAKLTKADGSFLFFQVEGEGAEKTLRESQWKAEINGEWVINGELVSEGAELRQEGRLEKICGEAPKKTGPLSPFKLFTNLADPDTTFRVPKGPKATAKVLDGGTEVEVYLTRTVAGNKMMRPGQKFPVDKNKPWKKKLDFISLMLALFCGTAALPHILIRYYTVPSPAAARKSTILAIAAIGFFYVLTMFLGLGATVNGVINPASDNMSAPLLARSFGNVLFAIISAIAFATVLGTVSGLIVAASGAVAHDLADRFLGLNMTDARKVLVGKVAAVCVGILAIALGIAFKGQNVSFLVGWAFSVAASANLPAIMMLLFWKRTTAAGITASIIVGILVSLGIILLSPDMYKVYGADPSTALISLNQPGIVSIPISFLTLIVVSLISSKKKDDAAPEAEAVAA